MKTTERFSFTRQPLQCTGSLSRTKSPASPFIGPASPCRTAALGRKRKMPVSSGPVVSASSSKKQMKAAKEAAKHSGAAESPKPGRADLASSRTLETAGADAGMEADTAPADRVRAWAALPTAPLAVSPIVDGAPLSAPTLRMLLRLALSWRPDSAAGDSGAGLAGWGETDGCAWVAVAHESRSAIGPMDALAAGTTTLPLRRRPRRPNGRLSGYGRSSRTRRAPTRPGLLPRM
jgi:hypothetical protein